MYEAQSCVGKNYIEQGRSTATLGVYAMKPFGALLTPGFHR